MKLWLGWLVTAVLWAGARLLVRWDQAQRVRLRERKISAERPKARILWWKRRGA